MIATNNTGPKDPALALEIEAEALEKTVAARTTEILDLARRMGELTANNDRDKAFAAQYRDAAAQLADPGFGFTMFVVDPSVFDLKGGN